VFGHFWTEMNQTAAALGGQSLLLEVCGRKALCNRPYPTRSLAAILWKIRRRMVVVGGAITIHEAWRCSALSTRRICPVHLPSKLRSLSHISIL
jgi:hypothetical protein